MLYNVPDAVPYKAGVFGIFFVSCAEFSILHLKIELEGKVNRRVMVSLLEMVTAAAGKG
jgi:hypothetical protein